MRKIKSYDVVYRKRRDNDSPLQFKVLEGRNRDSVKRKFWESIQEYDVYGNPKLTLVSINLRK